MKKNPRELRAQREELINQAKAKLDAAEAQDRSFTDEERTEYKALLEKADQLRQRAEEIESMSGLEATLGARRAPAFNRIGRGDSEVRAMAHYLRTGDVGGMRDLAVPAEQEEVAQGLAQAMVVKLPSVRELRAAVDSTMNITTAADGASAVPTGFAGQIAMRMTEIRLAEKLGVRKVPGKGTTVNFPSMSATF
jgi:HK97 family phage major capsid protein